MSKADVDSLLSNHQLVLLSDSPSDLEFLKASSNQHFKHDLRVSLSEGTTAQVRLIKDKGNYMPHIEVPALVSHLAVNDEDFDILMMSPNNKYLEITESDWAVESLFVPKEKMGDYTLAHLKVIYKEGAAVAQILYLGTNTVSTQPLIYFK